MTLAVAPNRAIATPHGTFLVQGLDRFAVGGDLDAGVVAAVAAHHARWGWAPKAVIWDDAVLSFRRYNLGLGLARVFVPSGDPFLAAVLDSSARAAVHVDALPGEGLQTSEILAACSWPGEVVQAPLLARMIGWPSAAPLLRQGRPQPSNHAGSVSVIINYHDKADTTISCLHHLRRQRIDAALELILVDNQSAPAERQAVEAAAAALFGERATIRHVDYPEPFNHSRQCNRAAALATGEVLMMLSNDCNLLDTETVQTLIDWAIEPGVGAVGPRLVGDDGLVACAGMALGPRDPGGADLFIHEAEVRYLSDLVRRTNGASFACCAVTRQTWERMGGADETLFTNDYNDADFCLRLTKAGYHNLYAGTVAAHHHPGLSESRTRHGTEALHAQLDARHTLRSVPRLNPAVLGIRVYPEFPDEAADAICDYVRLYRQAMQARREGVAAAPVEAAFQALGALPRPGTDEGAEADYDRRVDSGVRAICKAFLASAPADAVPDRYRESFRRLPSAVTRLRAAAARPVVPIASPAEAAAAALLASQQAGGAGDGVTTAAADDPDRDRQFTSFSDPGLARAPTRLLVFADALGPSQQILFLQALAGARASGHCGVRVVTEDDLRLLRSARGEDQIGGWIAGVLAHVRPSAIIFSRFADQAAYRAIQATPGFEGVPRLCHIDDDFFTLPAVIGISRYREGRHPRRIHGLSLVAAQADMILASTPLLGERLAGLFGWEKIALCPMHEGGERAPRPDPARAPVIGYYGAATHNRDLEMIAPALRRLKEARPGLRIEIAGSVARRSAAAGLGDLVSRHTEVESDYPAFRERLRGWAWTVGLAPLMSHPFNAAKTPIKWTEYAAAAIPVIASRTEPYLELGRQGALLLAGEDEWAARIASLLDDAGRRAALLAASDRLLAGFQGWRRMEQRLLGLVARAGARHRLAREAAA